MSEKKAVLLGAGTVYLENKRVLAKVDSGADISCLNYETYKTLLNGKIINKKSGYISYARKNNKFPRIGTTPYLKINYANGISCSHEFELFEFEDKRYDLLLGVDILPNLNIGLYGLVYDWELNLEKGSNLKENKIFEDINFHIKDLHEPNSSPYGTPQDQIEFMNYIKGALEANEKIPLNSFCTVPESVVHLPVKEGATAYTRQYKIVHALKPVLKKQIDEWLEEGVVQRSTYNTSFNSPLLLVGKKDQDGNVTKHRVCTDLRACGKFRYFH